MSSNGHSMMGQKKNRCPLSTADQRLSDALNLWRGAKDNYFSPDAFRLSLNNCIQVLRSFSWILQKSKSEFASFSRWYKEWQNRMRADPVLKWLVQARNVIVKEGDLVTHSKVRLAIVKSWFGVPSIEVEVPPTSKTEDITRIGARVARESFCTDAGLLRVERRWIDSQLSSHELLEALAHVFEVLSEVLFDAHQSLLTPAVASCCSWYTKRISLKSKLPSCMLAQEWDRTTWIDLRTGEGLTPTTDILRPTEGHLKTAAMRYPGLKDRSRELRVAKSLEEEAATMFHFAKTALRTDGYHLPIAILGLPDGSKTIRVLAMTDRSAVLLLFRQLATHIEKVGATSVIVINEMWMSKLGNGRPPHYPSDDPDRREVLQLVAADVSGETYTHMVLFHKDKSGKVHLGEQFVSKDDSPSFLAPVSAVWSKKRFH